MPLSAQRIVSFFVCVSLFLVSSLCFFFSLHISILLISKHSHIKLKCAVVCSIHFKLSTLQSSDWELPKVSKSIRIPCVACFCSIAWRCCCSYFFFSFRSFALFRLSEFQLTELLLLLAFFFIHYLFRCWFLFSNIIVGFGWWNFMGNVKFIGNIFLCSLRSSLCVTMAIIAAQLKYICVCLYRSAELKKKIENKNLHCSYTSNLYCHYCR